MSISSRTPEGFPAQCPVCGAQTNLEFSVSCDDAPCPECGQLLWKSTVILDRLSQILGSQLGADPKSIGADFDFQYELGANSLDVVELILALDEEFDVNIPADVAEQIKTVGDLVRVLLRFK